MAAGGWSMSVGLDNSTGHAHVLRRPSRKSFKKFVKQFGIASATYPPSRVLSKLDLPNWTVCQKYNINFDQRVLNYYRNGHNMGHPI
ncbi:hypothetical protein EVAR_76020_1 [Eumeta japonica]|uniref:Uncharacterized protein n=1 Tax=Eumeta variegata TaxID=151549 RepID=A0A4C1UBI7_EUMVA|nr:hypothetical protein EVAR_76020_1 [Eumeta japonica]